MFLKRTLAAGAILIGTAFAANAADLPTIPAPPPPMAAPAFDWSGMYIGAYGGVLAPVFYEAGVQAGINRVRGNFLFGGEAQVGIGFLPGFGIDAFVNGRLGFILGSRVLLYGELGAGAIILPGFTPLWTAKGGIEFALGTSVSLFAEGGLLGTFAPFAPAGRVIQVGVNWHR